MNSAQRGTSAVPKLPPIAPKVSAAPETIFVSGLARCGTSLVLQMLDATGVPTAGTYPDFEPDEMAQNEIDPDWLERHAGHAIKWLDPHRWRIPQDFPASVIWLRRDIKQQALSQFKLMMTNRGPYPRSRPERRAYIKRLKADATVSRGVIGARNQIAIQFEDLVTKPAQTTELLAEFLQTAGHDADPVKMRAQVLNRDAYCRQDMSIEQALIDLAGVRKSILARKGNAA